MDVSRDMDSIMVLTLGSLQTPIVILRMVAKEKFKSTFE